MAGRRRVVSPAVLIAVVIGGMLGVGARAALVVPIPISVHPLVIPGITLGINVLGSFLLGVVVGRLGTAHPVLRGFVGTGILGGFTTYSAFAVQTIQIGTDAPIVGLLLAVVSVFLGLVAAVAGLAAGRAGGRRVDAPAEAEL